MGRLLQFVLLFTYLFLVGTVSATNYYFSSVNGNDSNSGESKNSPKESLNAIKATFNSLEAGDTIFLERGSLWYQSYLILNGKNGTVENPIVFTAYGEGDNPVLSGQKILTGPEQDGNMYTFNDPQIPFVFFTEKSYGRRFPGYVTIGGKPYLPSRYPKSGYLKSTSTNRISVTDNEQSWTDDQWKDGWVGVKSVKWDWSVVRITSNTSTKLNTTDHSKYNPFGPKPYYIFNAYNAISQNGEWASKEGSISVFWDNGDLPEVKLSVIDRILTLTNSSYIHFSNIDFVGANIASVKITQGDYNVFDHCRMIGSGEFGVLLYGAPTYPSNNGNTENNQVSFCEIADCGSSAIFTRYCRGGIFTNNYIHRIAINGGYQNIYDNTTGDGPYAIGILNSTEINTVYPVVKQNFIDSVQAGVINHFNGYLFSMRENLIRNYGIGDLSDLGGFYSTTDSYSLRNKKRICKNFFLDVHEPDSSSQENFYSDSYIHAIYPDQDIYGVKMDSNSVENADLAINTNGGIGRTFNYNNFMKSGVHYKGAIQTSYLLDLISGAKASADTMIYNTIVLDEGDVGYVFLRAAGAYGCLLPWKGEIDHNKWFNPTGNAGTFAKIYNGYSVQYAYNFDQWQSLSETCDEDENNPGENSTYNDTEYLATRMFKNWSASERTFYLDAGYVDVDGNTVEDSVIVEPFFSKILFQVSGVENQVDMYIDSTLVPEPIAVAPAKLVVSSKKEVSNVGKVKYFPVPVNDQITLSSLPDACRISLFDVLGNKLKDIQASHQSDFMVDMRGLKAGIYLFRISDFKNKAVQTFKVIKK